MISESLLFVFKARLESLETSWVSRNYPCAPTTLRTPESIFYFCRRPLPWYTEMLAGIIILRAICFFWRRQTWTYNPIRWPSAGAFSSKLHRPRPPIYINPSICSTKPTKSASTAVYKSLWVSRFEARARNSTVHPTDILRLH